MEDLCASCLCAGRNLSYLSDEVLFNIYQTFLNEIEVMIVYCPRVCFQCEFTLRKFYKFKLQTQEAYRQLQNFESKTVLAKPPSLQTSLNIIQISYNETEVKEENKSEIDALDIKSEENSKTHAEHTFVHNLSVTNVKAKVKTRIKKKKIRKKVKKKRNVSESDSLDSFNNDNQDIAEELEDKEVVSEEKEEVGVIEKRSRKKDKKEDADLSLNITEDNCADLIKHIILSPEEIEKERQGVINSEDYVKASFKCNSCLITFRSKAMMKKHHDEKHAESLGPYSCNYCNTRFASIADLTSHVNRHSSRKRCNVCAQQDYDEALMLRHVREHATYTCTLCQLVSKSFSAHQSHLSSAHDEKPICVECGKAFSSRKTYRYHINVLHKGQNRFPCPHCGKVYQWKSNLWRHIKNHKARETGELYCSPCDKKFSSVATYRQHCRTSRRHVTHDQFNFVCSSCGARFVSRAKLKEHVDWEHLQRTNHKCHLCDKAFKSSTSLYVHVQNVHRNKEERDNLCHVCGKSYQSSAKLKYHIVAMHTSATPYPCRLCPAAFGWYSSLYRHVRELHHKVKTNKKPKKLKKLEELQAAPEMPPNVLMP